MLLCDYCLKWYHTKCEEYAGSNVTQSEVFKCSNCKSWKEKYDQIFKPVLESNYSNEILVPSINDNLENDPFTDWVFWKRTIFPKGPSHFLSLDDILLMGIIWQK